MASAAISTDGDRGPAAEGGAREGVAEGRRRARAAREAAGTDRARASPAPYLLIHSREGR